MNRLSQVWMNLGITAKGLLALAIPLITLLSSIAYLYQRELSAQSAESELHAAIVTLAKIQGIHAQLAEAATGVRGFLLTGRDDFLTRYYQARDRIPIEIEQLKQTSRDQALLANLIIMEPIVKQKLVGMKQLLAEGPFMTKNELISILVSQKRVLDTIREHIDEMREREQLVIRQKQMALQAVRNTNLQLTLFATMLGIISAFIAIHFYFSNVVKRILQLRDNAALLAQGLPLQPTKQASDEIGALAESLESASRLIASKQRETELARDVAEAASAAKTQFLSRTSHELRTPLNAILGFAQVLKQELPTSALQQSANHIVAAGNHLLKLINDVLNISRIESGEASLQIDTFNLQSITKEAVTFLDQAARKRNITLTVTIPDQLGVLADRDKLLQILINLISNAIKYGPSDATLSIWSKHTDQQIQLHIQDQGAGIPAHLRSRAFTPFDRLGAENANIEGVGLGLALSKELAIAMHGDICLLDQGSIFQLTLPISHATVKTANAQAHLAQLGPSLGKIQHILYVENNTSNIALIQTLLRREKSIQLHIASTATDALKLISTQNIDMILLDIQLPDASSEHLLTTLRSMLEYKKTPIIVLGADVQPSAVDRLKMLGANTFLYKPIDVQLFNQTIRTYLT